MGLFQRYIANFKLINNSINLKYLHRPLARTISYLIEYYMGMGARPMDFEENLRHEAENVLENHENR